MHVREHGPHALAQKAHTHALSLPLSRSPSRPPCHHPLPTIRPDLTPSLLPPLPPPSLPPSPTHSRNPTPRVSLANLHWQQETTRTESVLSLHDWWKTVSFVLSPWLVGHGLLYLAAMGM